MTEYMGEESKRILITGSRNWHDTATMISVIGSLVNNVYRIWEDVPVTIVHGGAKGADSDASYVAQLYDYDVEIHEAEWDKYGKRAGAIRNQKMVDLGADDCIGFIMPGSKGTWDCLKRACDARIPIRTVWANE